MAERNLKKEMHDRFANQYKKLIKDFSLTNFLTLVAETEPGTSEWAKLYGEYYLGEVRRRMPNSQPGSSPNITPDLIVDNETLDDFLLSHNALETIYEILNSNNEEKMAIISVFHRYIIDNVYNDYSGLELLQPFSKETEEKFGLIDYMILKHCKEKPSYFKLFRTKNIIDYFNKHPEKVEQSERIKLHFEKRPDLQHHLCNTLSVFCEGVPHTINDSLLKNIEADTFVMKRFKEFEKSFEEYQKKFEPQIEKLVKKLEPRSQIKGIKDNPEPIELNTQSDLSLNNA